MWNPRKKSIQRGFRFTSDPLLAVGSVGAHIKDGNKFFQAFGILWICGRGAKETNVNDTTEKKCFKVFLGRAEAQRPHTLAHHWDCPLTCLPSSSVDSFFRLLPQCSVATLLHSIFFKVVYCCSWSVQVNQRASNPVDLRCHLWRQKEGQTWHSLPSSAVPLWEHGDMLFKVWCWSDNLMSGIGKIVHFCFLGQRGLKLMGFVA